MNQNTSSQVPETTVFVCAVESGSGSKGARLIKGPEEPVGNLERKRRSDSPSAPLSVIPFEAR